MNREFVTKTGKNCYYSNIVNILNYYGKEITEPEFILLCNALNCSIDIKDDIPYVVIPNENCSLGLKTLDCDLIYINNTYNNIVQSIEKFCNMNLPVILHISTKELNYSQTYTNSDRYHYITILSYDKYKDIIWLSDPFIQVIQATSLNSYSGSTDSKNILCAIKKNSAQCSYIQQKHSCKDKSFKKLIPTLIKQYLIKNLSGSEDSVLIILKKFIDFDWEQANINNEVMHEQSFMIQISGCVTRFEYLMELFSIYLRTSPEIIERLTTIQSKWRIATTKMLKYSIISDKENFIKVIKNEIRLLVEMEERVYNEIIMI